MAEDDGTENGVAVAPGPAPEPMAPADVPAAAATSGRTALFSVAASAVGHLLIGFLVFGSIAVAQKPPHVIPVKLVPADQAPQKPPVPHSPQKQAAAPPHKAQPHPPQKQAAAPSHKAQPLPAPKRPPVPPPKAPQKAPAKHAATGAKAPPPPAKTTKPAASKKTPSWSQLVASLGMSDYGHKSTLPKTLMAALRAQVKRCWSVPDGWHDPHQVSVTLRFQLQRDGTLDGDPAVVEFPATPIGAAAAKAAMKAVRECGPYRLPAAQYDKWKDVQLSLAP